MRPDFRFLPSASSLLCSAFALSAQDTRNVTEPHIPSSCITLNASIVAEHEVVAPADERMLDTEHIQYALDSSERYLYRLI
jgi:polygalacturonase